MFIQSNTKIRHQSSFSPLGTFLGERGVGNHFKETEKGAWTTLVRQCIKKMKQQAPWEPCNLITFLMMRISSTSRTG